jgi:DNA invertase Pin-like site-specific DNA recombinase
VASITVTQFRCALYARVSTRDKGQEVENQLRQSRDFAIHSGWTIVVEYIDHESGKISDREQFQAMVDAASKRQFDALLFWSLDRLSREGVLPTLQHLQRLTTYGIGYRSFTEQYFDSCGIFRDAVIAIVATVAKQEGIRTSERVKAGLATARHKGQRLGRPRVFVSRSRIESLRQAGKFWREIAQELNTNTATARRAYTVEAI